MNVPAALAADLQLLTEVLDGTQSDVAATLTVLVAETALAVPSYLGLSVRLLRGNEPALQLTTFHESSDPGQIGTSLRFRMSDGPAHPDEGPAVMELTLYATQPGALIDLAADLAWLTGRELGTFRIDEDLAFLSDYAGMSFASWSSVNQARGFLMGRGLTADEADIELQARAELAGVDVLLAAAELLTEAATAHQGPQAGDDDGSLRRSE